MHAAVVRQGEIVEQGSHGELIQIPNGAYATLVRLQASAQQPAMQQKQQVADEISHQLQHSADPEVLKKVISSQVCTLFVLRHQEIVLYKEVWKDWVKSYEKSGKSVSLAGIQSAVAVCT